MVSIDHKKQSRHKRIARHFKGRASWRAWLLFILLGAQTVFAPISAFGAPAYQGNDPGASAAGLLELLTPEERVGQLFMVTFEGATADNESQIYSLINAYNIGGVVLRRDMDNFVGAPETLSAAHDLIVQLQRAEANASQSSRTDAISGDEHVPSYIPLLVAISQNGDGFPNDQILNMLSPQPNAMTLGATWNPDLARQTGAVLGEELAALGVNMLFGPSLDVLEDPRPESAGDLGVTSFGGDPYWVGRMGQAYIEGVHAGSVNRVAVVAKHLPGHGGIDRPPQEEVPTVRKSLAELAQVELPPFFAVTGEANTPEMQADAMLLAHIRYQGFQGNIRDTTSPISFDPQAFGELMALPAFAVWRQDGGLIVSDSLGVRAVRRNFDSTEQTFNSPFVARDAFLAGNDLLYLGNFLATGDPNEYTTIVRTVEFFAQKYREDQAFAERVDASVLRILTLKYTLYPSFILNRVLPATTDLDSLGTQDGVFFEIGRQAATLFSPSPAELPSVLPAPPGPFEQIVFISDSYTVQQCSLCEPQSALPTGTLAQAVLRLYGPGTGTQFSGANISSFSFSQLSRTLDGNLEGEDALLANLPRAEWVVFGLLKEESSRSDSHALRRLLAERPDLIEGKKVIVFALNAPYYLDATDLTRISAYYGLYSKNSQIAHVAARLLFREIGAPGSSPVSVEGVGYSLIDATSPDPTRTIALQVSRIFPEAEEGTQETGGPGQPTYQAGDLLNLVAGPILDHNGHIVPDDTPLIFSAAIISEGNTLQQQIVASTTGGVAQANFAIGQEGSLEIVASSGEPQARSDVLRFDVVGINPEGLALQATQTAQAELLITPSAQPTLAFDPDAQAALGRTDILDWFLIILISAVSGAFVYQAGINLGRVRWAVRWGLASLIGGLAIGSYLSFDLPGSRDVLLFGGEWGLVLSVLLGCALGWAAGLAWRELSRKRKPNGRSSQ